jgi:hypothetical protein
MVVNMWYQLTLAGNSSVIPSPTTTITQPLQQPPPANSAAFGYDFARLSSSQSISGGDGSGGGYSGTSGMPARRRWSASRASSSALLRQRRP